MPIPSKGASTVVFVNAQDLTRYFNQATIPESVAKLDNTMFGNGGFEESTTGLSTGSPSFAGIHTGDPNDAVAVFQAALGTDSVPVIVGLAGSTALNPAQIFNLIETKWEIKSGFADLVKAAMAGSYQGRFDDGYFVHAKVAESAGTGNSASIDNGAASTNGYLMAAMIFTMTGNDGTHGVEPIIQSSPDNSTWSTLHTMGRQIAVGAPASFAGVGAVPRYLRGQWIVDVGVVATFVLAVARR